MKQFNSVLAFLKYFFSLCCDFKDLIDLLFKSWDALEIILVSVVAFWVPFLRISGFLFYRFGIKIPFGLPQKNASAVLWSIYLLSVVGSLFNLISKAYHGYDIEKLVAYTVVTILVLVWDFIETKETIKKINSI